MRDEEEGEEVGVEMVAVGAIGAVVAVVEEVDEVIEAEIELVAVVTVEAVAQKIHEMRGIEIGIAVAVVNIERRETKTVLKDTMDEKRSLIIVDLVDRVKVRGDLGKGRGSVVKIVSEGEQKNYMLEKKSQLIKDFQIVGMHHRLVINLEILTLKEILDLMSSII